MALIECPECGKQISDKATSCPNCGAPPTAATSASSSSVRDSHVITVPKKDAAQASKIVGVLVLIGLVGVLYWLWNSATNDRAAPTSAGIAAVIRQPRKIVNERNELKEGQSVIYSFNLNTDARVQVQVTANPKPVDVMLMNPDQASKFREAQGKLFGGQWTYLRGLSAERVLTMDKTEVMQAGSWVIVVMRPREALLFTEATAAETVVTVY